MLLIKLAAAAAIGAGLLKWQGPGRTALVAFAGTALFFTAPLWTLSADDAFKGIADSNISIRAIHIVLLATLVALIIRRAVRVPWEWLPFIVAVTLIASLHWSWTPALAAGLLLMALGIAAWVVGAAGGRLISLESKTGAFLLYMLAAIVLGEAVVTVAQVAGLNVFPMQGRTAELMGSRANGTFPHPGKLGQTLIPAIAIVLAYTRAESSSLRKIAYSAAALSIVPIMLTGTRGNIIALALMFAAWVVLSWKDIQASSIPRWALWAAPAAVALAAVGAAAVFLFRKVETGGQEFRGHFVEVAYQAIARDPWGVGLNSYVEGVGPYDRLTSEGWPVHNVPLHMAVEGGILVSVLFLVPVIWSFYVALRALRVNDQQGTFARAYVAFLPALTAIALTDWGLISDSTLIVWFLISGYFLGQLRKKA